MLHGAASVEAYSLTIGSVLEERYPCSVPRYQRAYAWDDEAVEYFVRDLESVISAPSGTASHFFGGLVCIEFTGNQRVRRLKYEVVDGQQRLATFILALSCVVEVAGHLESRASASRNESVASSAKLLGTDTRENFMEWKDNDVSAGRTHTRPRLTLSDVDDAVFQDLVKGVPVTPTRESHQLLIDARASLLDMVTRFVKSTGPMGARLNRIIRLREALVEDSHVIHIVSKDRAQAYRLFSVLNHRGESLSNADLLRSRTLELLEGHPAEQEQVASLWDAMLAAPGAEVEAFFRALYPSETGERAKGDLFEAVQDEFLPGQAPATAPAVASVVQTVQRFHDELAVFRQLLRGTWPYDREPGVASSVHAWQVDRLRRLMVTLKHELSLPVLLGAARSLPEKEFADLVYMLEIFAFRYKIICNGHASKPATIYYRESKAMRAAKRSSRPYVLTDFRNELRSLIATQASDQRFKEFLAENLRYSNTSQRDNIREFLTTIEDHWQWLKTTAALQANAKPKPSMSKVIDVSNATLEHIYPQKAKPADKDLLLEPIKHALGNLTFFGQSDNVAASNKSFANKVQTHYASSSVSMTAELATQAAWADTDVAARESALLDAAVRVFIV